LHRIRHYGLLANGTHKASLALARALLDQSCGAPMPADKSLDWPRGPRRTERRRRCAIPG